jgi:predicted metal-dependent peptidase
LKLDVETKLAAARTRLIIDKPFLGALVLRLPLQAARPDWCRTTATDARKLYFNPEYIEHLTLAETQFVLAQEALHCALAHFSRRGHRLQHLWDLACDFAINPILIHDGLTPPPGAFLNHDYDGMTAEEIYPFLLDNENDSTHEETLHDRPQEQSQGNRAQPAEREPQTEPQEPSAETDPPPERPRQEPDATRGATPQTAETPEDTERDGRQDEQEGAHAPPPLTPQEQETLEVQWQQRLAGAAQQARQAGKLSGDLARLVDWQLAPQLPWRALLSHYMTAQAREDYSYTRPSSRRGEPAIFPSLRSHQLDIVVALDTSGSITPDEMESFITEINAIKGQMRARVRLHTCDDRLNPDGPWQFDVWETMRLPSSFKGGGATDFTPVFAWIQSLDTPPDLMVYFTDAEGRFPAMAPHYPVLWLVKGREPVPWGQRIQLN